MHVVRSLTFQHHADDNVDDDNKSLADILHIPEKKQGNCVLFILKHLQQLKNQSQANHLFLCTEFKR